MYPHFFDAAVLGESLKEVATDLIKTSEAEIVHRWFHSPKDADFFIWMDTKNNVIKQQMTFYGQVVEWNIVEGVRTGLVVEVEGRKVSKASELIRFDAQAQPGPVGQALSMLKHIPQLNDLERHVLMKNFAHGPTSKTIDPDEFVLRFGAFLKPRPRGGPSVTVGSKLRRLFGWIRRLLSPQS